MRITSTIRFAFAVLALLLIHCGGPQSDVAVKAWQEAAKACRDKGGVAIVNNWGEYKRCEFLPEPKELEPKK